MHTSPEWTGIWGRMVARPWIRLCGGSLLSLIEPSQNFLPDQAGKDLIWKYNKIGLMWRGPLCFL